MLTSGTYIIGQWLYFQFIFIVMFWLLAVDLAGYTLLFSMDYAQG